MAEKAMDSIPPFLSATRSYTPPRIGSFLSHALQSPTSASAAHLPHPPPPPPPPPSNTPPTWKRNVVTEEKRTLFPVVCGARAGGCTAAKQSGEEEGRRPGISGEGMGKGRGEGRRAGWGFALGQTGEKEGEGEELSLSPSLSLSLSLCGWMGGGRGGAKAEVPMRERVLFYIQGKKRGEIEREENRGLFNGGEKEKHPSNT